MSVEVLPVGQRCNLSCSYCYEDPMRQAGNAGGTYSVAAMKAGLAAELLNADGAKAYATAKFTVFGGEPLLVPLPDLCELWAWGLEKFGENGIQTNGSLLTDAHVEAFHKYRVRPGLSIDGPGQLNDARWAGTLAATRRQTARSESALRRLLAEKLTSSVIVTLSRKNASAERLPLLLDWLRDLSTAGLVHVNLHLLETETDAIQSDLGLTVQENAAALLAVAQLQDSTPLRVQPILDMVALLLGRDDVDGGVSCIWNACDPYTTDAVRGVLGDGTRANCGRTNKDGVAWVKADSASYIRQLALHQTPQEHGGCQGCRFFFACKGQCPGTAIGNDWRNRTAHCEALLAVFEWIEKRLLQLGLRPISTDAARRELVESRMLAAYRAGRKVSVSRALAGGGAQAATDRPHQDTPHGDHEDVAQPVQTHGDHTDAEGAHAAA